MYNPKHYQQAQAQISFQPIDLCRELPFSLGNAIKYILRAPYKGNPVQDYAKAIDYLEDYRIVHTCIGAQQFTANFILALEAFTAKNKFIRTIFNYHIKRKDRIKSPAFNYIGQDEAYSNSQQDFVGGVIIYSNDDNRIYVSVDTIDNVIKQIREEINKLVRFENNVKEAKEELEKHLMDF